MGNGVERACAERRSTVKTGCPPPIPEKHLLQHPSLTGVNARDWHHHRQSARETMLSSADMNIGFKNQGDTAG